MGWEGQRPNMLIQDHLPVIEPMRLRGHRIPTHSMGEQPDHLIAKEQKQV
jgi:hypothetical protein